MSGSKKKTPAEELIESLLKDVGSESSEDISTSEDIQSLELETSTSIEGLVQLDTPDDAGFVLSSDSAENEYDESLVSEFEGTRNTSQGTVNKLDLSFEVEADNSDLAGAMGQLLAQNNKNPDEIVLSDSEPTNPVLPEVPPEAPAQEIVLAPESLDDLKLDESKDDKTTEFSGPPLAPPSDYTTSDSEKTVAVAGYQVRSNSDYDDKIKVSVGQNRSGYSSWNSGGSAESNLAQAENLRIAQEKIIELERENEKLRLQNEEMMAASEIIKERSDLLSSQLSEYKNDRDGLEDSFKNEIVLLKNHLARKDTELQRAQFKNEELESRLKFDMKKIRVRERELENRLELIRAEKNAVVKNKDEQILDLRRKMDILQMEVESYRQKCVELNKSIESSQESFKRTTRALRLAMANLELQEENKAPLKKVD